MVEMGGMDRRSLLAHALILVGASAAVGACQTIAPVDAGAAQAGGWRFSPAQLATLSAAADTLVPTGDTVGATDVHVPALFEGLMANWAAPATRTAMLHVLGQIDALPGGARHFAALPLAERTALLSAHDRIALAPSGAHGSPLGPAPATDPAYQKFKQLVLTLFYLSQPALTQELSYTHIPGRWDPSVPVTSATRPQGGPGMF